MNVLGVRVEGLTMDEVISRLDGYLTSGRSHHLVTVNPEFLVLAQGDPEFRAVLNAADLSIADGVGLVWAAKLLGYGTPPRVAGVDLVERLAETRRHSMFLLGGPPGVAEAAAAVLTRRYSGVVISGTHAGSPAAEEEAGIVERVRAARPDILLVAYGAPQQDLWIHRNLHALGVPLAAGVGGSFDFISGRVPRAPGWMRRIGLEWLFRLITQPWRWRRMLRLPVFVWLVIQQRVRGPDSRRGRLPHMQ